MYLICTRQFLRKFLMQTEKKNVAILTHVKSVAIICQSSRILRTPTLLTAFNLCDPPFLCYLFAEGDDTSTHQTEISNSRSAARPSTLYPLMPRVELLKTALRDHRELDCSPTGSIRRGERERNASVTSMHRRSN